MKKNVTRLACLMLAATLALSLPMQSKAAEAKKDTEQTAETTEETQPTHYEEVKIATAEDLVSLAKRCRLDSASRNLKVTLTDNISLADYPNLEIPTFGGIFDGGNHKITNVKIDAEGSAQGLFRYLQKDGKIMNLEVVGKVLPTGSATKIGGVVGVNNGSIQNVTFSGTLEATDQVGGLVGYNAVTGRVISCTSQGYIRATKVVGGVVGKNEGVVTGCINKASVNTQIPDDSINLEDITFTKLTTEDTKISGSDIGGVVGSSSGVIRGCKNEGDVGYQHTGYNVGGVAGSSSGFMAECENFGFVQARKEGGGILGQMEPNNVLVYSEDTLQKLEKETKTLSNILSRTSNDAASANSALQSGLGKVEYNANTFVGAINYLLEVISEGMDITVVKPDPDTEIDPDMSYPDIEVPSIHVEGLDEMWAAAGLVGESLSDTIKAMSSLADTASGQGDTILDDIQDLSSQISRVVNVLSGREDNENLTEDVSGEDVEEDSAGKIRDCVNYGDVNADINAGGIVGALSWENDLDPEDDLSTIGDKSLNFSVKTRGLVYKCVNHGTVQAKKQVAGGIAGKSTLGAIISCEGYGYMDSEDAEWVGGIVGLSQAEVRDCWAKCGLVGKSLVGGIAGEADEVTDCRSLVTVTCEGEYVGAILGKLTEDGTAENNVFVESDLLAGIDGISYQEAAEPVTYRALMALDHVPGAFQKMVITFVSDDATESREVEYNKTLRDIPEVPAKEGYNGVWKDLDPVHVQADQRVTAEYTELQGSADSGETGLAEILAEGKFPEGESLYAQTITEDLPGGSEKSWSVQVPEDHRASHTIHLRKPDKNKDYRVFLDTGSGWQEIDASTDGSYLVFAAEGNDFRVAVRKAADATPVWVTLAIAAGAVLVAMAVIARRKKRKAKKA